jgi:biopolymer transport protein ExbB
MLAMGASPILYLMLALSVVSLAVIVERAWYFLRATGNVERLASELDADLTAGNVVRAREKLRADRSVEARIVLAGLMKADRGAEAVAEAMIGASTVQRMKLERGLAYLGTLGSNAPFIGLLGTVVGIIMAFERLSEAGQAAATAGASAGVMASIAEALVATAVGLAIAIPAIVSYNYFQRRIKAVLANTDALGRVLLSWLKEKPELRGADDAPPSSRRPALTLARPARAARGGM